MDKHDLTVETIQEKLDKAKNHLETINANIIKKRENTQNTIQKCNDVVENANRYLSYETDAISDLLHAILCSEIGEKKNMDEELFQIREHTFQDLN